MEGNMAGKSQNHATHIPEAKSALWKVFEVVMGPGLMLAVLIALAAHLVTSDRADELGSYAARHQSSTGPAEPKSGLHQ